MNEPKMAARAPQMIGFKAAMREFEKKLSEHGSASGQILFVMYPDGSLSPYLNGRLNVHQVLAAQAALVQVAADMATELEQRAQAVRGPAMPLNGGNA